MEVKVVHPSTPEAHISARVEPIPLFLITTCDVIIFKGPGQLWQSDLSNHTQMSAIQWSRPEKNAKKTPCTLDQKIPFKILSHNPLDTCFKIISRSSSFLQKRLSPSPGESGQGKEKKRGGEKAKCKSRGACACPNFKSCNFKPETKAGPFARLVNNVLDRVGYFW